MRPQLQQQLLSLPNVLSAMRVPLALAFPLVTEKESALALIGAAGATDLLDGWSARKLGQGSAIGATIDGFADKAFGISLLGTLVARGVLAPASALLLATREILELPLAVRVLFSERARAFTVDRSANRLGKVATALELAAVVASIGRMRIAKPLVIAAGVMGALAGISYWARELSAEREHRMHEIDARLKERHVPYVLAGGNPAKLSELAA